MLMIKKDYQMIQKKQFTLICSMFERNGDIFLLENLCLKNESNENNTCAAPLSNTLLFI